MKTRNNYWFIRGEWFYTPLFSAGLLIIVVLAPVIGCASASSNTETSGPAYIASALSNTEASEPAYIGTGGKGKSITIFAPQMTGLMEDQDYLPALIQGEFMANFNTYSAISVFDRMNLDKNYLEALSGNYADDNEAASDFGHLVPTDYFMNGNITKTSTGYIFQIQITKIIDKMLAASYSGICTNEELENFIGIRRISLDLLTKMDVELTAASKTALSGAGGAEHINAQTALAQGIAAQQKGTIAEAMAYYYSAVSYDPKLSEANELLSVLSSNVSSGNIGDTVRNDIQRRNEWVKILTEAEVFFSRHLPFEIIYSTSLTQGRIDYTKETVDLKSSMILKPTDSIKVFDTILQGLDSTGKRQEWGLGLWPIFPAAGLSSSDFDHYGSVRSPLRVKKPFPWVQEDHYKRYTAEEKIVVDIVLINENGMEISKTKETLRCGIEFARGRKKVDRESFGSDWNYAYRDALGDYYAYDMAKLEVSVEQREIYFSDVNVDDITSNLTIKITGVNDIDVTNITDYIIITTR